MSAVEMTLTRNEQLVLSALDESNAPKKAYDLLHALKPEGVNAPMTVYRALDALTRKGLVHKIDALNAFIRCSHGARHKVQQFFVCRSCGAVDEAALGELEGDVVTAAKDASFSMETARLEVLGVCADCTA